MQSPFFSTQIPPTSTNSENTKKVEELVSIFCDQTLDSLKLTLLHKTLQAARLAMTDRIVLNHTNIELLLVNLQKKL